MHYIYKNNIDKKIHNDIASNLLHLSCISFTLYICQISLCDMEPNENKEMKNYRRTFQIVIYLSYN